MSISQEEIDHNFMGEALEEAREAARLGEVPVGALVVGGDGSVIARAGNRSLTSCDPTAHAEICALRQAASYLRNYRLLDTTVYVTLEPCIMCMGAMIHARVRRLVFGALDPKTGAVESRYAVGRDGRLNHLIQVTGGVRAQESAEMLRAFFRERRGG